MDVYRKEQSIDPERLDSLPANKTNIDNLRSEILNLPDIVPDTYSPSYERKR